MVRGFSPAAPTAGARVRGRSEERGDVAELGLGDTVAEHRVLPRVSVVCASSQVFVRAMAGGGDDGIDRAAAPEHRRPELGELRVGGVRRRSATKPDSITTRSNRSGADAEQLQGHRAALGEAEQADPLRRGPGQPIQPVEHRAGRGATSAVAVGGAE